MERHVNFLKQGSLRPEANLKELVDIHDKLADACSGTADFLNIKFRKLEAAKDGISIEASILANASLITNLVINNGAELLQDVMTDSLMRYAAFIEGLLQNEKSYFLLGSLVEWNDFEVVVAASCLREVLVTTEDGEESDQEEDLLWAHPVDAEVLRLLPNKAGVLNNNTSMLQSLLRKHWNSVIIGYAQATVELLKIFGQVERSDEKRDYLQSLYRLVSSHPAGLDGQAVEMAIPERLISELTERGRILDRDDQESSIVRAETSQTTLVRVKIVAEQDTDLKSRPGEVRKLAVYLCPRHKFREVYEGAEGIWRIDAEFPNAAIRIPHLAAGEEYDFTLAVNQWRQSC